MKTRDARFLIFSGDRPAFGLYQVMAGNTLHGNILNSVGAICYDIDLSGGRYAVKAADT